MSEIFTIAGIGIISAGFVIILREYRPEFAFGATVAAGIIIILYSVSLFTEISEYIDKLVSLSGINQEKYQILLRCAGVCIVSKIASETCKDCGQASIASKIEFSGKIIVLFSAMPLFMEVTEIIRNLINI